MTDVNTDSEEVVLVLTTPEKEETVSKVTNCVEADNE